MLSVTESGSDLTLLTWTGTIGGRPTTERAEHAYASLNEALVEHGTVPIQERIFGDLESAPAVARGRAQAVGNDSEPWAVPPTYVEGAPVGREGLAGIHVLAARADSSQVVTDGGGVLGRIAEGPSARFLGLSDVGRRAAGRLAPGPAEDTGVTIESAVAPFSAHRMVRDYVLGSYVPVAEGRER